MILLVTYNLKGLPGGYAAFYETLKQQGHWWHYLNETWLISTTKTPKELFSALEPHLNFKAGDRVLVTTLGEYWGWLPKEAWDWIESHL